MSERNTGDGVYRPPHDLYPSNGPETSPADARKAALRAREALRQQRPLVWPPATSPQPSPPPAGKPKKGWFGRRKNPPPAPAGRQLSYPEVYYEPAAEQGPLPAYTNVDARSQASANVRRGPASAFTVENGTVEPYDPKRKRKRGSALAGGRWRRVVLTTAMMLALTVLVVNGLYRLAGKALYEQPVPPPGSGFPAVAASGYAARFGQAYLTWDAAVPQARIDALRVFFPDARSSEFGWDGTGRQSVLGAPVVAGVSARDDNHAVVHLAAYLNPGGWTCMDVAMYAAPGAAAFAITSYVAFMECPPAAAASVPPVDIEEDRPFEEQLRPAMETFLKGYAASTSDITQSTTEDSGITGLGGIVSFVELVSLVTAVVDDPSTVTRVADVRVRWRLPSGGTLMQAYRLTLRQIGGRWFVQRIEGGVEDADVAPNHGGAPTPSPVPTTANPSPSRSGTSPQPSAQTT